MVIDAIKRHAKRAYPEECCGIVAGDVYIPLLNRHEDPVNHFRIETKEYLCLLPQIQGLVHSHTNGRDYPSREDMLGQMRTNVPWGIVLCNELGPGTPFWFGDQVPIQPLIERTFRHGVTDCYALVRDWYRLKRGIRLPNLARDWEWWEQEQDILVEHFSEFGFVEIPREAVGANSRSPLQWGDCVMGRVGPLGSTVTNHCGVYVGENQILHHLPNRPSRIDMLGPWSKIITHYVRYAG